MNVYSFLLNFLQTVQRIFLSPYAYLYMFPLGSGFQLWLYIKENLKMRAFLTWQNTCTLQAWILQFH